MNKSLDLDSNNILNNTIKHQQQSPETMNVEILKNKENIKYKNIELDKIDMKHKIKMNVLNNFNDRMKVGLNKNNIGLNKFN